jgi:lysophospholipase L1-like esterase
MKRRTAPSWAVMLLVLVLGACTGGNRSASSASTGDNAKPTTLLTIGGSATEGDGVPDRFRAAWPYLLFDDAFPISTSLVNAALDDATVANARADQLPLAREVKPQVVAVWLGMDDLAQHTPINQFSSELRSLIEELRIAGAQRILVADLPRTFGVGVIAYDRAIRSAVQSTNATFVELQNAAISLVPSRGLADQPDAASHRVIATAFEQALKRA